MTIMETGIIKRVGMSGIKTWTIFMVTRKNKPTGDNSDTYIGSTCNPHGPCIGDYIWQVYNGYYNNSKICLRMNATGVRNWEVRPILTRTCTLKVILEIKKQVIQDYNADLNVRTPIKPKKQKIEYDIFKNAPSLPTFKGLTKVARNRGISWKVIKGCKKIELAQLLNIPLIMNPNV